MAGILIAVALYSVNRQKSFMESCSKELKSSLMQAQEVKCDLEEIMLNTINLSKDLVDDLERKTKMEVESQQVENADPAPSPPVVAAGPKLTELQHQIGGANDTATNTVFNINPRFPGSMASPELIEQPGGKARSSIPVAQSNSKRSVTQSEARPLIQESQTNISGGFTGMRVHELADELKTSSRELLSICQQMGLGINHHMNMLTAEQIAGIKAQWFFGEQYPVPGKPKAPFQTKVVTGSSPSPERLLINPLRGDRNQQFSLEEIKQAHPYMAVRTLSEQGYDQKEIARILGRGQSEISLILNLTKRKQVSNA